MNKDAKITAQTKSTGIRWTGIAILSAASPAVIGCAKWVIKYLD